MWRYYNHAFLPKCCPHEEVDTAAIKDGSVWKQKKGAYLARWTSDFDCGYETEWWYVIKDSPFELEKLPSNVRKHIRQAFNKCEIRKLVDVLEYSEQLWRCYLEAHEKYKQADNKAQYEGYFDGLKKSVENGLEYWACFSKDNGQIIGYMTVAMRENFAEIQTAKYSAKNLKSRPSDALHATVLPYYLNERNVKYVCSGERNINHITKAQEYKIETFQFRKAYCKLNVVYNPKIKWLVKIAYPFRKLLLKFDGINIVHQLNGVLKMEEIVRKQKNGANSSK